MSSFLLCNSGTFHSLILPSPKMQHYTTNTILEFYGKWRFIFYNNVENFDGIH